MEDTHIVQMYWDRNETAISESAMKYGTYCTSIAQNILRNPADAEECVNDTWLHAWNAMHFSIQIKRKISRYFSKKCG